MCMTCIRINRFLISAVTTIRMLSQFPSVPLQKCQVHTSIWSRQLPSTHFPIRYSLTILHSIPQSLIANLKDTTYKQNKNSPLFPLRSPHWSQSLQPSQATDALVPRRHLRSHPKKIQSPWRWKQRVPPKRRNKLIIHGVITQNTVTGTTRRWSLKIWFPHHSHSSHHISFAAAQHEQSIQHIKIGE